MTKTFTEAEISIERLDSHLRDSGMVPYDVQPDVIRLRTEQGIAFRVFLIPERKFVRFATYLPLNRQAPTEQKHELARRLNESVFLPVFTIDPDEDLSVSYALPYGGGGLIAGNFMSIVNRFASLLEFVVETFGDGLIDFGTPTTVPVVADAGSAPTGGELLH